MAYLDDPEPQPRSAGEAEYPLFQSIEFKGSRQRSLSLSVLFHGVLLTALLLIPLLFTETIHVKWDVALLAPPPPKPKPILEVSNYREPPKPKAEPKPVKPLVAPPAKPVVAPPPKPPAPPKPPEIKIPDKIDKPAIVRNVPREEPKPVPAAPKPEVRTGLFSTASPPAPTTNLPPAQVQTGGFGDPNGIKGEGKRGKAANIASLGSFDLPAGPGAGNGSGGARGVRGIVDNAGFGSAASPAADRGSENSTRVVRQGGFGDAETAKSETPRKRLDTGPPQVPAEILFKPKPDYTEEARKQKLEGEVLVRVIFTAGGEVRVLEVTRGLGHGLDESAIRAARQIRFKPALKDGQPVDSTATVRISFQLAY